MKARLTNNGSLYTLHLPCSGNNPLLFLEAICQKVRHPKIKHQKITMEVISDFELDYFIINLHGHSMHECIFIRDYINDNI